MSYDFNYYTGADIEFTIQKPSKPVLSRNPDAAEARAFADKLEKYDVDIKSYNDVRQVYNEQRAVRLAEFKDKLRDDYDISQEQFNVLWDHADANISYGGLEEVFNLFDSCYEVATKFAALEK